mmetsp:Transcript_58655/g.80533  ORF Transcript_58655/g.80533 Transcript_58655/m.80533 type:complete len:206 (+) Transcript_58655:147-764(+)
MVRCLPIRPSVVVTTLSTPSSPRLVLVSTFPALSSSISSLPLSMKLELVPTDSFSTPSSSSPVRRMPLTTSPEVTTPSVRRSSISASIELESSLISALVSRVSSSSTPLVVVPVPVLVPSSSRDFPLITVRSPSSVSPSTPLPRSPPPSLSLTTPCSPPTPSLSIPMLLLCLITRPFTISAEETSISRDPPTPTLTDSSLRLSPL